MARTKISKLLIAALLLGAGAAHAAGPASVSEAPGAWYADRIVTPASAPGAMAPIFPSAAYEHGPYGDHYAYPERALTRPTIARSTQPFPASPNESGATL